MQTLTFTTLETNVLSAVSNGITTFENISAETGLGDKTLSAILGGLTSKEILRFSPGLNGKADEYLYETKVIGDVVVLEGNILLPTTILKLNNTMLVSRGEWYELPLDFDIRRIVWNVKLPNDKRTSLMDMIVSSVAKVKKTRVVHNHDYDVMLKKTIPYNDNIHLIITAFGDDAVEVQMCFRSVIGKVGDTQVEHRGFQVRTEISTEELKAELSKPNGERNFQNININQIFDFSDFIFSGNEIPYEIDDKSIKYITITGIRKKLELSYYYKTVNETKRTNVETYDDQTQGIEILRNLFVNGLPNIILAKDNILCEPTE